MYKLYEEMQQIDDTRKYYCMRLAADENGNIYRSVHTMWVGWGDEECKQEIRKPSIVNPYRTLEASEEFGYLCLVITKKEHYLFYQFVGGEALIEQQVAHQCEPELFAEKICMCSGEHGFVSVRNLPRQVFNHAPTPKLRMRILKRDGFQCRICGRSPRNYVDLELHVHHIRPWAKGGLTEEQNLITLCHTCHNGLDPHNDSSLFSLVRSKDWNQKGNFLTEIIRYQEIIKKYTDVE